ncbi:MAG: TetR/AcrR family transcriptional regulator [Desulfobacterales bacterium]|nr:TetR/AcrR family transcriptional regulator [Desulfobacterales bacterium]
MADTKTKILNAAEKLILKYGAEKTSMRMITEEAHVNLAAVNYHFGSKQNLVDAIFARFVQPVGESQLRLLTQAETQAGKQGPPLEIIVRCYVAPLLEFVETYPHHRQIFLKLGRPFKDFDRFQSQVRDMLKPVIDRFGQALLKALPEISHDIVLIRLSFMMNTSAGIFHAWQMENVKRYYGIAINREEVLIQMVEFITSGLRGGLSKVKSSKNNLSTPVYTKEN